VAVVVRFPDEFWPESRIERLLAAPPLRGLVVDISMTGVACILPQRLEPGTVVYLRLTGQLAGSRVDTQGSVLRAMPCSGKQWLTVCTLKSPLPLHQIDMVRDQIDAARFV
jgi:hypothetical protein